MRAAHVGFRANLDAAARIESAIERVAAAGILTRELGGKAGTTEVGDAIAAEVRKQTAPR